MAKRILVVAHYPPLQASRVSMLHKAGYEVESVDSDDAAMELLEAEHFDLILIGRKSSIPKKGLDQRLRERYPHLLILKIENGGEGESIFPSQIIDTQPAHLLKALRELLGDEVTLSPVHIPNQTGLAHGSV